MKKFILAILCLLFLSSFLGLAETPDTKTQEIQLLRHGFWSVLGVLAFIAFYVLAVIRVQAGEMKVIVGWGDLFLLLGMWTSFGVQYLNIMRYDGELLGRPFSFVLMGAIIVLLLVSLFLTIRGNSGFFNVIYALIMKLIVIPLVPICFVSAILKILFGAGSGSGQIRSLLGAALSVFAIIAFVSMDDD